MSHDLPPRAALPPWFAAVSLLVAGAAIGVFAGRWSAMSGSARDAAAATPEVSAGGSGLEELRRSIDELARALRERATPPPSRPTSLDVVPAERQPALADTAGLDRLASAVERLGELLRASSGNRGDAPAPARPSAAGSIGPGYPSLGAMRASLDAIRRAHPDDVDDYANREFSRAHVLWTREDVLDRYGLPARVEPNGDHQVNLVYEGFDVGDQRCYFCFCSRIETGGLVMEVVVYFGQKDDH